MAHFFRDNFEESLENLPQIRSLATIERIDVWLTNDRNDVNNGRDIVAIADLGEHEERTSQNNVIPVRNPPRNLDVTGETGLPSNDGNNLYGNLIDNPLEFYTQQQAELEKNASSLKKKLINLGVFRLFVFLGTVFLIYLTFGNFPDVLIIAALGFSLFSFYYLQISNRKCHLSYHLHHRFPKKENLNPQRVEVFFIIEFLFPSGLPPLVQPSDLRWYSRLLLDTLHFEVGQS